MFDPALITKCADPSLNPAIVERFIADAGSANPLAVTVKSGDRLILVPAPKTSEEAMAIVSKYVGNAVVRIGITQYPAGIGVNSAFELNPKMLDTCENIRAGTALFAKVYRIVVKWYGSEPQEALDDALYAWRTGYFEGKSVFLKSEPGKSSSRAPSVDGKNADDRQDAANAATAQDKADLPGPAEADPRIDLSRINGEK